MTGFDDRRDAMEKKYAYDEKKSFDIEARTSKLFGLWAAEQMGIDGDAADIYAKEVVMANLDEPGFGDILRKVTDDLAAKGIEISAETLEEKIEECNTEATRQILEE